MPSLEDIREGLAALDAARAAALFDAEGSVGIQKQRRGNSAVFVLRAVVHMRDPEWPDFLHQRWGGSIGRTRSQGTECHRWMVSSRSAAEFLMVIYPWILTERRRDAIALALAFQAQKLPQGHGRPTMYPQYGAVQRDFYERMRVMNLKGDRRLSPEARRQVLLGVVRG